MLCRITPKLAIAWAVKSVTLDSQLSQALLDVSGIFSDGVKCTSDVGTNLRCTLVFYLQGQLHHRGLQGELILVQPLENIRK